MSQGAEPKIRRTAPREERWRQLIDAAMVSIAQHGLSGTTTAIVTETAGLSAGIVSLHFGNKENLLVATLESLAHEHRDRWAEALRTPGLDAAQRLWAIMEAHFDPGICTPTKIAVWFAFFGEARYRATYRRIVQEFDFERTTTVEDCCRKIIAEGSYETVEPSTLARSIESFADGLWLDLLLYPDEVSLEGATLRMRAMLNTHFPKHFPLSAGGAPDDEG